MDQNSSSLPNVTVNGTTLIVELATTNDAIKKGLSGRPMLATDRGMLFIFPKPGLYRFWMLDMRFPIDIIWINDGHVVSMNQNVGVAFDAVASPRQSIFGWLLRRRRPIFYSPTSPAQYVLEVNAGFSAEHRIIPGNEITFQNIPSLS
jgi:uncharacterized membrane protein (UPF0127 family)